MIYLDNSSTTPVDPEVYEAMIPYLKEEYGNPSSKYYSLSRKAKKAVEWSREQVAKLINGTPEQIIFTAGSTESNNLIIKGVADYQKYYTKKGNHIITSSAEHKSVLNICKFLNGEIYSNNDATFSFNSFNTKIDRGYEVTFLPVNKYGQVESHTLENAIKKTTTIVSIIWGNNEIGTLNDIISLGKICKKNNIYFHSDATQVLGKIKIDVKKIPIDYLSFSAHKIYGPKGVGAAYLKGDEYGIEPMSSLLHGGSQEQGYRAGTLAVHNIVGFGKAAEIARKNMDKYIIRIKQLEDKLINMLKENFSNIEFLGNPKEKIPGIISIVVHDDNFNNERFLKRVSDKVAISAGSACTSTEKSHILEAIDKDYDVRNVIRISIGKFNNEQDIYLMLQLLKTS